MTKEEWAILRSQSVTLEGGKGNHPKYLPFTFTEQGVAMLSAVLNSQRAIQASIQIMRAFVMIRQWSLTYQELAERLEELERSHGQRFDGIEQVLNYFIHKDKQSAQQNQRKQVGYKKIANGNDSRGNEKVGITNCDTKMQRRRKFNKFVLHSMIYKLFFYFYK